MSAHVGDRRCEGSQSQGQSSWLGLKGTGQSQGGPGPTFPVKSGKHGQSQGTGVHISSPTFEANPLVPTTPLDDTINTLSLRPCGPLKPRPNPQREDWSIAGESGPPAPGLTRGGAGLVLRCGLRAQYCTALQAQNAQAAVKVTLTLQAADCPFWRWWPTHPLPGLLWKHGFVTNHAARDVTPAHLLVTTDSLTLTGQMQVHPAMLCSSQNSSSLGGAGRNVASQHWMPLLRYDTC